MHTLLDMMILVMLDIYIRERWKTDMEMMMGGIPKINLGHLYGEKQMTDFIIMKENLKKEAPKTQLRIGIIR